MSDITLAVRGEVFRVYPAGMRYDDARVVDGALQCRRFAAHEDYPSLTDALKRGYIIAGALGVATVVDRITKHEPVRADQIPPHTILDFSHLVGRTETITGTHEVGYPGAYCAALSRHHAVNGSCLPTTICLSDFPDDIDV